MSEDIKLPIAEIFTSPQGEGQWGGYPHVLYPVCRL